MPLPRSQSGCCEGVSETAPNARPVSATVRTCPHARDSSGRTFRCSQPFQPCPVGSMRNAQRRQRSMTACFHASRVAAHAQCAPGSFTVSVAMCSSRSRASMKIIDVVRGAAPASRRADTAHPGARRTSVARLLRLVGIVSDVEISSLRRSRSECMKPGTSYRREAARVRRQWIAPASSTARASPTPESGGQGPPLRPSRRSRSPIRVWSSPCARSCGGQKVLRKAISARLSSSLSSGSRRTMFRHAQPSCL